MTGQARPGAAPALALTALAALAAGCDSGGDPGPVIVDQDGGAFVRVETLTPEALGGRWSWSGGRCAEPDFTIAAGESSGRGLAVRAEFNGWDRTGRLRLDEEPSIRFVDPERILPVALQDGGLHVGAPTDGLAVLGSRNIFEDGVIFHKCSEAAADGETE